MTNHILKTIVCLLGIGLLGGKLNAQVEVPFTPRLDNSFINIKGDYTFLSNSIINRVDGSNTANDPYNGTANNNGFHRDYIDIDSDPTTFSSSSSTLSLPFCSRIYWAGLYWSANYQQEVLNNTQIPTLPQNDTQRLDFTQVKFRVPGSATYMDLVADNDPDPVGEEDAIIYDNVNFKDSPYTCFKNVTNILQGLANPEGEYFVGNVRATRGRSVGGAGGWTLVIIYENPTLNGRYISVFDGYAGVSGSTSADINVSGFNTIPVGPVRARLGASVVEGDRSITGDAFRIETPLNPGFTSLSNGANPSNNFFNSNITIDGVDVTTRNITATNTLGYDSDIFEISNPANSIIANTETDATLRLFTQGDAFGAFLVTFGVEIIEPNIVLEKRVEDIGGNDITGLGVNLGQYLDYILSFVNTGNDDATGYVIRDVLPQNVTLDELNITLPPGVTYVFDAPNQEITFTIPDNLVEEGDPISQIRMRVQVAENCFDFVDACTDVIENQAFSTYEGVINDNQISDDPSVSDFDDCGFTTPGATNFLLDDLTACNFTRTVQLCGDTVTLDAGDNFDAYIWYRDENGDNTIDAGDTVLNDGDPDNDPSTLTVDDIGTYIVDKQVADPCKDFGEIIIVERVGATQTNPITTLINDTTNTVEGEIVVCPNDGSELPEIFLCGLNDTELVQVNIPDADSISWELLDESSCTAATPDCANTNNSCTWNVVETGSDFVASDAGQYRLVINYQNGCFSRFYFNIFKNPLNPQANTTDIICATPGNITVTNMPLDYEYRLIDQFSGNVLVAYNPSPSFTITNNGAYTVEMRQQGVVDGCVFVLDNIGILDRDFQVDVTTKDTDCNGLGEISISVLNVEPQYYYEISQGGVTVDTFGPSGDNNYTFENLNDGLYDVIVSTDDGCNYTEQVTINDVTDLAVTALTTKNIDCTDGIITVTGSGGFPNPEYAYAIWSFNGVDLYTSVANIPGSAFQVANDFTFTNGEEGDYEFIVVDGNNCSFISNVATVAVTPAIVYTTSQSEVSCFGGNDGSISYNVTDTNGYTLDFTLTPTAGSPVTNSSGTFTSLPAGDYTVTITQTLGTASCDQVDNFTITQPASGISGNAVLIQDFTCLLNGSIEAQNVTGGTAPYEYSIDGVNFVSGVGSETFSNLTNGTYTISIRDANNCIFNTNAIVLDPLNPPTDLTFTASTPNCPALTSDITATAVNGDAPFVFEIIAPASIPATTITGNTADFDGLAPDTYTYRVTDGRGCVYEETFTINPVSEIAVTGQFISNISCLANTDGELLFTVSDFNTDYDYTISGPSNFSGNNETNPAISLTNLDDGTYDITVTDNLTSCTANASITINAPPAALTLSASAVQPTCTSTGSVTLSTTGGWGGNNFTLTNPDATPFGTNATGIFNNLTQAGLYTATVTDSNGCMVTTDFTLSPAVAPVLAIVPNDTCYDAAVGLTLTANVTSGGDGNYEYSLNGGAFGTNNIFTGLTSGTYTIEVRDGNNCTDSESITINPELSVIASAPNITACGTTTNVDVTAAGGDGNYVYALVANGVAPTTGDFAITNPISVTGAGDYDVYVRDVGGVSGFCEASFDITITQDAPLALNITDTGIQCSGEAQANLTIVASGGEGPYQYSIDNGTTYQTSDTFVNQLAGSYDVRVRDANSCEVSQTYTISEPFTLSASAAVTQLAECNPGVGAEVRITNAIGGTAPYEYSFDGGTNYGTSPIGFLLPGTHTVYIRDANNCTFPMTVTVDPEPTPPGITPSIVYECDGEGTVTLTPDSADFDYTYEIGGSPNSPATSNIFDNVPVGTHTFTVNYTANTPPAPSVLLLEDFGSGPNTPISEVDPNYCYEPLDGTGIGCNTSPNALSNGEYTVTQNLTNPWTGWRPPNDHTGNTNGRFLAIDLGTVVGLDGIIYAKRNVEIIPNRELTVSMFLFNMVRDTWGGTQNDPNVRIELVDGLGTVIDFVTTGDISRNINADDWRNYSVDLDPGANTNIDIVIRTNINTDHGNDLAIDDILAFQTPEVCAGSLTVDVVIEDGRAFDAAITAFSDVSCNGDNDGSITFEVENFDAVNGFEYRLGTSGPFTVSTTSPVTLSNAVTGDNLVAGTYQIEVRDVLDNTCTVTLNQTIGQPNALETGASVTDAMTCTNGGATITSSILSGGTPGFEYRLEDASTLPAITVVRPYQASNIFTGVGAGDYIVRARDANGCEDPIDASITIAPTTPITYTFTACYGGNNDGSIQIDVTAGNSNYEFSLNGGPWTAPSPASATTFTFSNLVSGNYTINVRDGLGCVGTLENVTIYEAPIIDVIDLSTCNAGSITVTAPAALTTLEYAFVPTGNSPAGLFSTTNTLSVTTGNDGDYDVYVRDTSTSNAYCDLVETVTVNPATPLTVVNTPTDPQCHNGNGSILVNITSGIAPYTIQIVDLDNGGASDQTDTNQLVTTRTYFNLMSGDYTINVTDASGCTVTETPITINNPDELTADILPILPPGCDPDINLTGFEFDNYPLTLSGTLQFSANGGVDWQTSDTFTGMDPINGIIYASGTVVNPSIRTVDASNNTLCQIDLPQYIIPYPLDDLNITISAIIVDCNDLQVTVQGTQGSPDYEYTFSDDPANFDETTATWTAPTSGNHVFTGLIPGRTYVFYVRDSSPCVRQSTVNVNDVAPPPVEITADVTPSCFGASNGQITYTVTEDNPGDLGGTFTWNLYELSNPTVSINSGTEVGFTSGNSFTVPVAPLLGLAAGTYFVEIQGAAPNNCLIGSENAILLELDPLAGTPTVLQNISCDAPGLVQIQNPTGGGGIYTYTLFHDINNTPANLADDITITTTTDNPIEVPANSAAGSYRVSAQDQYGCSNELGFVSLTLTPNPTIDAIAVNNCTNPATVNITASSTAPQILYSIDGGTTFADNGGVFNNVAPGTYTVAIRDSNGCSDTSSVTVYPILEADVQLTKLLDCSTAPSTPDAQITIEVLSGSGSYNYEISNGLGSVVTSTALPSNPFVFNTSTPEDYTITVYDNNTSSPTCSRVFNITVPTLVTPAFNIVAATDVTCFGSDNGTITVNAVDTGNGPYNFQIISGPGSTASFPVSPTSSTTASATFTGLEGAIGSGITYTIRMTAQGTGCTTTQTQAIIQPSQLSVSAAVTPFACSAGNTADLATITVTASNGTAPYLYSIDNVNFQTSNTFNISDTGAVQNITVYVTDANNCPQTDTVTIQPLDVLASASISVDNAATCVTGEDITITAQGTFTNSTSHPGNYQFRLLPGGSFQASGSFTGLSVGTHNFEIQNTVTNCIIVTSHEVSDPEVLHLDVVNTTDITCFGDTNGAVELDLQDASNTTYPNATSYTLYYDVNNTPINLADDVTTTGSDADGAFSITGLAAGTYFIEVVDDNPPGSDCTYSQSFTIAGPNVGLSANTQVSEVTCALNDGSIEIINAAGGWGGYSYYVGTAAPTATSDYVASPLFENLSGGVAPGTTYQVWIKDQFDCEHQLADVILVNPDAITATLQINTPNCTNIEGEIEVVGTTGGQNANYTFQLRRNGTLIGSPQTSPIFTGLGEGIYLVEIADQWSCAHTTNAVALFDEIVPTITVDKPIDCTLDPGGHVTVSQTGGSGNFTYAVTFPDLSTPLPSNNTGVFTDLTLAGTYTFSITDDAAGHTCVKTITLDLDDSVDPSIVNVLESPVNCNGGSDGSLTVELGPATAVHPVYTYELYEIANLGTPFRSAQTSNVFDNLPAGDYRVRVISARSCDDFFDQTVTEPAALSVSAAANTFSCTPSNTVNTATVTVSASNGTAPYLYSIDNVNFQTSNTFDIVDTGVTQNLTVFVRDANACLETDTVTLEPINVFSASITQNIAISCANPEEILITVTDNGVPTNSYSYTLLPVGNTLGTMIATPTNTTATFELSAPGSYTFRITDTATNCYVDTASYTIAPFDLINVVATPTAPVTCFGDTDGEASLNVTGYSDTYDYEVFNADGTTTGIMGSGNSGTTNPLGIGNLPGGNFFIRVVETANPLCVEDSNVFTIVSPDSPLDATPLEVANVTCANNIGEIEVSPTGGYAPYDIVLTNTTSGQIYTATAVTSIVFNGLSAGTFNVEITDNNGCVINRPITLTQPTPITADITATPTNLNCFGDTNATVSAINVLNGRGVYQYQLNIYDATGTTITSTSGLQSNADFNNLGAGIYSITVSDGWNCDVETIQVTITEPTQVMANLIQVTPLSCTNPAELLLSASGGTAPYEFSLDNIVFSLMTGAGGDTESFTVPDGVYQYYVRDALGCEAMISNQISVDPITPLDVLIDDSAAFINCTGEASATILANAIGGLGNYVYELFSDAGLTNSVTGPQNDGEFNNLLAGTYYVQVTSMDCEVTSGVIEIQDPAPLQIDRQESTDVTCVGLEDGTITVEVSGGTGEIFYAITPNLNQFDTVNEFTDLAPGIYDVIAQDRNGCFETFQFIIEQPDPLTADAINIMHEVCFESADGSFELDISGGTAPYFTSLNSNVDADFVQDQILFQNLAAGTQVVFVRDAQGCETNVFVEINPGVNLDASVTPIYSCNGILPDNRLDIVFEDVTVTPDVLYAIDSTDPLDMQLTSDFTNILPGNHFLTIAHANGCINTIDFSIEAFEPLTLVLENTNVNEITATASGGLEEYTFFFGDVNNGTDNTFIINRTDTYPLTVIDQNGCEVTLEIFMEFIDIEIPNFFTPDGDNLNDEWIPDNLEAFPNVLMVIFDRYGRELHRMGYGDPGWTGIYNNSELPTGDYWYLIKLQGENDDREFIGHFTLYRQ